MSRSLRASSVVVAAGGPTMGLAARRLPRGCARNICAAGGAVTIRSVGACASAEPLFAKMATQANPVIAAARPALFFATVATYAMVALRLMFGSLERGSCGRQVDRVRSGRVNHGNSLRGQRTIDAFAARQHHRIRRLRQVIARQDVQAVRRCAWGPFALEPGKGIVVLRGRHVGVATQHEAPAALVDELEILRCSQGQTLESAIGPSAEEINPFRRPRAAGVRCWHGRVRTPHLLNDTGGKRLDRVVIPEVELWSDAQHVLAVQKAEQRPDVQLEYRFPLVHLSLLDFDAADERR